MKRIQSAIFLLALGAITAGCADVRLRIKSTDMISNLTANSDDQQSIRRVLDIASHLKIWTYRTPEMPEMLYRVVVWNHPNKPPHCEIIVNRVTTSLTIFNDPNISDDDETLTMETTRDLWMALAEIGEYK